MKRWAGLCIVVMAALLGVTPAQAVIPPVSNPNMPEPDEFAAVLISSVHLAPGGSFVELHSQASSAINLGGWKLRFSSVNEEVDVLLPAGWLLADSYVVLSENGVVPSTLTYPVLGFSAGEVVGQIELVNASGTVVNVIDGFPAEITTKWYQRKSTGLSSVFTSDFSAATTSTKLRHTPPYQLPAQVPVVQIVEILPNSTDCAPSDTSLLCYDYIKLFNPSQHSVDVGNYRLRSDSSTSESSNAFHLDQFPAVPAGGFLTVAFRDDGDPISLTDGGGYVWLEDAEGIQVYDDTTVQYPSAGSSTKVGWSWARANGDTWQWSSTPQPDSPNLFSVVSIPGIGSGGLSACPAGKYRNPETNRCRTIEDAINALAVCDEGQYRNPETNRCRKVASLASTTLTPCDPGEVRSTETNRCRKVTSGGSILKPCDAGEERNQETNRCRKVAGASTTAITEPAKKQGLDAFGGIALGVVGLVAVSYGIYEWRSEIAGAFGRLLATLGKK